jgi:Na+-transporting methylmalonyl-CoA/oxaloacetate decarboxylase gamma subunit
MNRSLVEVLFAVLLLLAFAGFGIEAISHRPAAAAQTAESSDKKKKDTAAESTSTAGESKPVAATPTSTPSTGTASAK